MNAKISIKPGALIWDQILYFVATFPTIEKKMVAFFDQKLKEPKLTLQYGTHQIKFKDQNIIIIYNQEENTVGTSYEAVRYEFLTVQAANEEIIQELFLEAYEFSKNKEKNMVSIRVLRKGSWFLLNKLPSRKLDTIYLPNKNEIINDIELFYSNEKQYEAFGIPFKRNFLFSGPPGTGKSSLIFSLASYFEKDLAIMAIAPDMDDSSFMMSVSNMPENSILILEDVDTLFNQRAKAHDNQSFLSFSAILNVLDGIARKHGLITIMTTNFADRLDSALIRPGRIDKVIEFKNASDDQIKEMFCRFIPSQSDKAEEFIKKLKEMNLNISIAELQHFLFTHREDQNLLSHMNEIKESQEARKFQDEFDKKSINNSTHMYI